MELVILFLMFVFGLIAVIVFVNAMMQENPSPILLLVEVMILQIIAILGLTYVVLKVWEQHIIPDHVHKNSVEFFKESKKEKKPKAKKSK